MIKIVYANDGTNVYDQFFLDHLTKANIVYFLTFESNPKFFSKKSLVMKIPEPLTINLTRSRLAEGLRMHIFSFLRGFLFRNCLRRIKPHIVLANLTTTYGFYAALSGFKPFILIVWGSDILIAPKRFLIFRFIANFTLKKADAVIVDSDVQEKAVIEFGCDPRKILKFPWFDLDRINVEVPPNELRARLGWRKNPIIINTRKHESVYGVEYFIEAIPHVIKQVPDSRFLILGKGRLSDRLKRRVKELGADGSVKFLGNVPHQDVFAYLSVADAYVSASLSDGTSASLLEAMTFKIPPVVTNIPGNKEWIKDGWNGYLVPVKDPQQLAEKIILLLEDGELRQQIGRRAFETVSAKVDWHTNSTALNNLISRLVKENR